MAIHKSKILLKYDNKRKRTYKKDDGQIRLSSHDVNKMYYCACVQRHRLIWRLPVEEFRRGIGYYQETSHRVCGFLE